MTQRYEDYIKQEDRWRQKACANHRNTFNMDPYDNETEVDCDDLACHVGCPFVNSEVNKHNEGEK